MTARIEVVTGGGLDAYVDDLARLRIEVFREFPYLYDGSIDYERRYLATYAATPGSVVVLALDGGRVVGASTGLPLLGEPANVREPIAAAGLDVGRVFYYGESVLSRAWRGQGIGVNFFDVREAHARAWGAAWAVFCAVERPADHPRRPAGYAPLDAFWRKRGFHPLPGARCTFSWQDLDEAAESPKPMAYWVKALSGA